ncbi:MAG: hypothetical protein PHG14_12615 [Desulfobacter postgatei]|uniref:hypothetical protein n=1 Tax=Desulfobacter postgatei TaxID=2293 RepID=UPI0023EFDFA5|nr:hypothetical protein [Desulfobacter postgatei]MDD4274551.1 hypothetical protein [Desulfobacter postgatei]
MDKWEKITLNFRIYKYLTMLLSESKLSAEKIRIIQFKRLKSLLCDAYLRHPFYRERFLACGLNPFKMSCFEEFKKIPLLTKEEYREFTNSFCNNHFNRCNTWYRDGTSGSTGTPLTIYRTWNERAYMVAKYVRALRLNGYNYRDITFSLPSPHRLQKDSFVQRFGFLKRYSVPYTAPVEEMVKGYLSSKSNIIYGNKSQLVMMAIFCQKNGIKLPKPKLCVSAAETMEANSKELIQKTFGNDNLIQVYGAVEFNTLAWQEKGDDFFRISHTTNIFEIEEDSTSDFAKCYITDLIIRSFPLIRYDLGDKLSTDIKNDLTVIKKIHGRLDDWIIFSNGERLPFHAFYEIMERRPEILQFRVVQENYGMIRIQVLKKEDADASALKKILIEDLRKDVCDVGMEYKIEWVKDIEPDPSGKLRMLISKVKQDV